MSAVDPPSVASPGGSRPTDTIDARTPSIARVYDAVLGGKDNYDVDRSVRGQIMAVVPDIGRLAWDNREFVLRVTRFLAAEKGVAQFLDCGTGLPTKENTHEAAQRINPDARVVYVDNDPVVLAHGRALLAQNDHTHIIMADVTGPDALFADPLLSQYLDLDRPLAVYHIGTLHHLGEDERPQELMRAYINALPSGSYLALSHFYRPCDQDPELGELAERLERAFLHSALGSGRFRSRAEIAAYLDGLDLLDPGLVPPAEWRPEKPRQEPLEPVRRLMLGAVARKP